MAEEVEMTPVEMTPVTGEPPKVDPIAPAAAAPAAPAAPVAPAVRKPVVGAPTAVLKPGLKLPPKPVLGAGLKLPPKPGLAAGVKLPPKPGATIAAKPVIRKPGEGPVATAIPKPLPKPIAPAPAAQPAAEKPAEPAEKPLEALKAATQKLKSVTQAIPQQAVLHKTGIIADASTSDAQKEAAKHKTARIALSDAIGVAPVKSEPAPMKTIRIKRPVGIGGETAPPAAPAAAPAEDTTLTQRKTLKISRPGTQIRPAGKFSVKKPGATAPAAPAAEAADAEVADIPEMPTNVSAFNQPVAVVEEKPGWPTTLAVIVQIAACVAIAALVTFFYNDSQMPTFCGGLGWGS